MRDVRRRERLVGVKRPTRREHGRRGDANSGSSPARSTLKVNTPSDPDEDPPSAALATALPVRASSRSPVLHRFDPRERGACSARRLSSDSEGQLLIFRAPGLGHLDPFGTLPGNGSPSRRIDDLVNYCEPFHPFLIHSLSDVRLCCRNPRSLEHFTSRVAPCHLSSTLENLAERPFGLHDAAKVLRF